MSEVSSYAFTEQAVEFTEMIEMDEKLAELYKEHCNSIDKQKIPAIMFLLFKTVNREKKTIVYEYIKKIKESITEIDADVLHMIHSSDPGIKKLGLKIIRLFWKIFEMDEVIVYNIRKHKPFYKLLNKNPKYSMVYKHSIMKHKSKEPNHHKSTASVLSGHNSKVSVKTKKNISGSQLIHKIKKVGTLNDLILLLNNSYENSSLNDRKIIHFFINKIETTTANSSKNIPGINMTEYTVNDTEQIDLSFELTFLGLDSTSLYKEIYKTLKLLTS